jgi:DNA-binding transcriptional LysR family regulator
MTDAGAHRFVRSHLKTRQLVLLVELGRHGSILRAAEAANVAQPAASKMLSELEHALGAPLFDRLPRGVTPTGYGEIMIRRAGTALAELDAAHQEVMELLAGLSGRVAVGAVLTPSSHLLPEAIRRLKRDHPRIDVSLTVETSKLLIDRLRSGELDIVVGRILDGEIAHELHFEVISDEPHSLIVRTGHPLLQRTSLALEDLAGQDWILPPRGSILRDRLTALFLARGLDRPVEGVETLAVAVSAALLMGSDMIAALPEELMRPYLDTGVLCVLPFDLGLRMDAYGIVTRRQHQLSPGADAFLRALRGVVAGPGA